MRKSIAAVVQMSSGSDQERNLSRAGRLIRESFGHSMIVDPWGRVLARQAQGEGLAVAGIDPALLSETRRSIPVGSSRSRRTVEEI